MRQQLPALWWGCKTTIGSRVAAGTTGRAQGERELRCSTLMGGVNVEFPVSVLPFQLCNEGLRLEGWDFLDALFLQSSIMD